jgi:hypothetical protein
MKISRRKAIQLAGATVASATAVQVAGISPADALPKRVGTIYVARLWGKKWVYRRDPVTRRYVRVRVNNTKGMYRGTSNASLNVGIGVWPDSAAPGSDGHLILFGHRTSHGGPMNRAHYLRPGIDEIVVNNFVYVVEKVHVVTARPAMNALTYPADLPGASGPRLSIVTCSLPNGKPTGTKHRLVVRAKLKPPPEEPPTASTIV